MCIADSSEEVNGNGNEIGGKLFGRTPTRPKYGEVWTEEGNDDIVFCGSYDDG